MPEEMLTIDEAAKRMRAYAETTANHSQNWNNFEGIAKSMLQSAFQAGANQDEAGDA